MGALSHIFTRDFMIAALAAVAAAAVVFTLGFSLLGRSGTTIKQRIKRVALEREKMRAEEMTRLRGTGQQDNTRSIRRVAGREYVTNVVNRFSLQKMFADENTVDALARAGYRGQGPLNTYVFARFVTPFAMFVLTFAYLSLTVFHDKPLYLNALYAVVLGLIGAFLPNVVLKNRTIKRQQSIKRAWPDALDLMLLCVEAGMSVEHAFKRVSKEIGLQSAELAEEITLTTAELSFLEDRTRAYDNLGKRTGLDVVKSVMTSLIQADRYGTSVGTSLRVMAEEGRETRMMDAEKKAASLPPKLTVPLIVFFLPVLFIVIISPAIIKIMATSGFSALGGGGH
jgi:tight adherence protein C